MILTVRAAVILLFSITFRSYCAAQVAKDTRCVLKVTVVDFGGRPMNRIPAQLVDVNNGVVWEGTSSEGSICVEDFPFGQHSLVVAPNSCHPVEIHNLRLDLILPPVLFVTVQGCPHLSGGEYCNAVLRVTDEGKVPIATAAVTFPTGEPEFADKFGRIRFGVPYPPKLSARFRVTAPGFNQETVTLECKKIGVVVQREIVLRRSR